MEALAGQLADKLKDFDGKGVLVLDMSTPQCPWLPFGALLADQFSAALAKTGHEVEVVDRLKLKAALDAQHLSPKDEFDAKSAIALAKSLGANTLILGTFGATENAIGVSVVPIRVSDNGVQQQRTFTMDLVRGKIALTPEMAAVLQVPLDSLRPKDGIASGGVGGVSVPVCLKCDHPSMQPPDVDLQGLMRERRYGATLILDFVVSAEGRVTQVTVTHPLGFGTEEQFQKVMKDWQYKPALDADDKPVPVRMQIKLEMNINFPSATQPQLQMNVGNSFEPQPPMLNVWNGTEEIARQLADKLNESDRKGVLVVDLYTPQYPGLPFGAWLADQFSAALAKTGHELHVVDRLSLKAALDAQHLSPKDEVQPKNAIALAKSLGANTLILGTFGAAEKGIGITLVGYRIPQSAAPNSNPSMISMIRGKLDLTAEIVSHLDVPFDSLRPKDGVYISGYGGVSVPSCVKCPIPSGMHAPDVDLPGMLRAHPHGATVWLRFVVTAEGHATHISVVDQVGYGFDEQYVKAAESWEFQPAVDADNKPVPVVYDFHFYVKWQ
ncbi:MAG TPA: TonB family protein [Candidatus Acidoferrales bacterium]|nr:TonB family protein [Candidatus Acidoferrales bacterium]